MRKRKTEPHIHAEDLVQKAAMQYFGEEVMPWLNIPEKVQAVAATEMVKVEMRHLYEDFTFVMQNGKWYHFEFESDKLKPKDLRRFREYEATTSAVYGVEVITCVISSCKIQKIYVEMKTGISHYRVQMISLKNFQADEIFGKVKKKSGSNIRKKDLIPVALCPLLGGEMSMKERVMEGFQVLRKTYEMISQEEMLRLQAILYVLALKFLDEKQMNEIREEVNMSYLGRLIYNDGLKDGVELGREQGIEKGIEKGIEQGIMALILDNLEEGAVRGKILIKLQKRFQLNAEKAEAYLDKCEKELEAKG